MSRLFDFPGMKPATGRSQTFLYVARRIGSLVTLLATEDTVFAVMRAHAAA
jgi:hypothetical protein